jgi:anti-anti-sigma regulatory factor
VTGIVRLLNTAGGRALCLAGSVDAAAVEAFLRRYGREPARVDVIDAGSVTALSAPGAELLLEHLQTAERAGREVSVRRSPVVDKVLSSHPQGGFSH